MPFVGEHVCGGWKGWFFLCVCVFYLWVLVDVTFYNDSVGFISVEPDQPSIGIEDRFRDIFEREYLGTLLRSF